MNFLFRLFPVFFFIVFFLIIGSWAVNGVLAYKCYTGNDRHSMACYMLNNVRMNVQVDSN